MGGFKHSTITTPQSNTRKCDFFLNHNENQSLVSVLSDQVIWPSIYKESFPVSRDGRVSFLCFY